MGNGSGWNTGGNQVLVLMGIRLLLKLLKLFGMLLLAIFVITPFAVYIQGIDYVDEMPQKPVSLISKAEVYELWSSKESRVPATCASITPFWFYRWLAVAIVNDFVHPVGIDAAYHNYSNMAGHIAIHYLRNGHFKKTNQGMLWWHLTNICLTIWIQRNWTAEEIATAYKQIL